MKREDIQEIILQLFRTNFFLYPESYLPEQGITPGNSVANAKLMAEDYWENRLPEEVKRDSAADVTAQDYISWILVEHDRLMKFEAETPNPLTDN